MVICLRFTQRLTLNHRSVARLIHARSSEFNTAIEAYYVAMWNPRWNLRLGPSSWTHRQAAQNHNPRKLKIETTEVPSAENPQNGARSQTVQKNLRSRRAENSPHRERLLIIALLVLMQFRKTVFNVSHCGTLCISHPYGFIKSLYARLPLV